MAMRLFNLEGFVKELQKYGFSLVKDKTAEHQGLVHESGEAFCMPNYNDSIPEYILNKYLQAVGVMPKDEVVTATHVEEKAFAIAENKNPGRPDIHLVSESPAN